MTWFQTTYTVRYNARHRVSGHLFAGRYKALLVDPESEGYLATLLNYIHLNPVRAGMVEAVAGARVVGLSLEQSAGLLLAWSTAGLAGGGAGVGRAAMEGHSERSSGVGRLCTTSGFGGGNKQRRAGKGPGEPALELGAGVVFWDGGISGTNSGEGTGGDRQEK